MWVVSVRSCFFVSGGRIHLHNNEMMIHCWFNTGRGTWRHLWRKCTVIQNIPDHSPKFNTGNELPTCHAPTGTTLSRRNQTNQELNLHNIEHACPNQISSPFILLRQEEVFSFPEFFYGRTLFWRNPAQTLNSRVNGIPFSAQQKLV